ncbi:uncharacterized protein V6R79_013198 [Siganus canaliculatus]
MNPLTVNDRQAETFNLGKRKEPAAKSRRVAGERSCSERSCDAAKQSSKSTHSVAEQKTGKPNSFSVQLYRTETVRIQQLQPNNEALNKERHVVRKTLQYGHEVTRRMNKFLQE